tara:strand:- start:56904 stop:57155 length:252 start_codon:yes stop_codon:yes gene_type:complete
MTHDPQQDAMILSEAEAIKLDPQRVIGARDEANNLAAVKVAQANALNALANQQPNSAPATEQQVMQSGDGRQLPITRSSRSRG